MVRKKVKARLTQWRYSLQNIILAEQETVASFRSHPHTVEAATEAKER